LIRSSTKKEIIIIYDNNLNANLPDLNVNKLFINVRISIVEGNIISVKLDNCFESQ